MIVLKEFEGITCSYMRYKHFLKFPRYICL